MISGNKCQNCGKGIMYGHNVSHSKRRTKRIFKPNLHTARISVGGIMKRMKLCAKCMRLLKGKSTRDRKIKEKVSVETVVPSFQEASAVTV
ncbi:MAG: 50S ribosomal protein L28 [Patescibacteria group bacterium]